MGTVTLADDTVLGRQVALKRVSGMAGEQGMLRLGREALVGASVSHPNLVSVYDVETSEEGDVVIVMEYVEGETLRHTIARRQRLPPSDALPILAGAAAALDAIHQRGIVHRDVKPANILLGAHGTVKVADLGIASVVDRTRITTSGAVLGSLSYMAPEQLDDAPATPAMDVYALAAVAYELLSGQKARREANPVALAYAISTQPPPDLRQVWPEAPAEAAELLMRAMSRDPNERPSSAGQLVGRLQAALTPESTEQTPALAPIALERPSRPEPDRAPGRRPAVDRRPSRSRVFVPLLALLAVAGIVAVVLTGGGGSHHPASRSAAAGAQSHRKSTGRTGAAATANSPSSTTTAQAPSTAASAHSPSSAVQTFYTLAAAHRYGTAWALTDPTLQSQLGGYQSFENTFSTDRSITFGSARTVAQSAGAATVAISTRSVQTTGTHTCSGTVDLRSAGAAQWQLHMLHVSCT
jgi:serine/threonine-protein kinase